MLRGEDMKSLIHMFISVLCLASFLTGCSGNSGGNSSSPPSSGQLTLNLSSLTLSTGTVGKPYSSQEVVMTASGGTPPYSYSCSISGNPLGVGVGQPEPTGGTCVINGIPSTPGTFTITLGVTDATQSTSNESISLIINPSPWIIEAVSNEGEESLTSESLTLDSDGNAHISYIESRSSGKTLKYATNRGGGWTFETVETAGEYHTFSGSSVAVDSSGNVHISYIDSGDLKYATNKNGLWIAKVIDNESHQSHESSIMLDSSDNVHIAYASGYGSYSNLKYATNKGGTWTTETASSVGSSYVVISLASDPGGTVHIGYGYKQGIVLPGSDPQGSQGLSYVTNKGGTWSTNVLDNLPTYSVALSANSSGTVNIVYSVNIEYSAGDIKKATNVGGAWSVESTNCSQCFTDSDQTPSITIDKVGDIHISYRSGYNESWMGPVFYRTYKGGIWSFEVVDSTRSAWAGEPFIAVDVLGHAHILYDLSNTLDNTAGIRYAVNTE